MRTMARFEKFHVASCTGKNCACRYVVDRYIQGRRERRRFRTIKEAELYDAETQHRVAHGEYIAPALVPKFGEVAEDWFQGKKDRRPSHVYDLRTRLDKHIL